MVQASRRIDIELSIPPESGGVRFDQALAELVPQFSRSRLTAWIRSGQVSVNGKPIKPKQLVSGGERVHIQAEVLPEERAEAEDIPLRLIHQDASVFVIDKPAGLVTHPGAGNPSGTLLNALLALDPALALLPRAGIVHRLDKDTSGLMVVARTLEAHTSLVEQLQARTVHRQYEAIVLGTLVAGGTVDAPIGRHPVDRLRMAVVDEYDDSGKPAVTHYRLVERFAHHTHVRCFLETGRTHQIRVHMAHIKHPLLGDGLYGGRNKSPRGASAEFAAALRAFPRQALHAERLEFVHPETDEAVAFETTRPDDLEAMLAVLRGSGVGQ